MKHYSFRQTLLLLAFLVSSLLHAQVGELPRATPESVGISSKTIIALFDSAMALPKTEIHSLLVLRHGKVVGELYPRPFAAQYRHTMYSCSKTFVAAAIGLAIDENRLRLTDRVAAFFPEHLPDTITPYLADMTVRDLLVMASGIKPDWNMRNITTDWIRTFLAKPVKQPGIEFQYDSMVTYMLSAIVQKVTGMTMLDYLKLKLFDPMHITEVAWELSPEGINTGGWGLHIQSESLAKFGLLLLNEGRWEGRQLLSASWVKEMTSLQMEREGEDYGYQTWLCEYPGAVRADGALGQFVIMVPEKDMVIVITECSLLNGKPQRNLFWHQLLPAVADAPLAPSKDYQRLLKKQAAYQLPVVEGKASSSQAIQWADKKITLQKNKLGWQELTLHITPKEVQLVVTDKQGQTYTLPFGHRQWLTTSTEACPPYSITPIDCFRGIERPFHVSGSYAWLQGGALRLKAHYVDWVTSLELTFRQENGKVELTVQPNYSAKPFVVEGEVTAQ
ncbi:MAG: serine hydrolase [Bacteroides sp.]|nr:serine hydrolase [Bacteroides sp.]